jgi:hypothetical protein
MANTSTNAKIQNDFEGLYDKVRGDNDDFIDEEDFRTKVEELVDVGYIEKSMFEDTVLYYTRTGLTWSDFVDLVDNIKKSILLLLVENPTTFFVLLNTQKGKMRINSLEIQKWSEDKKHQVVAFAVVDNDATLADQSAEGINKVIGVLNVELIKLQSSSKTTFEDIKRTIDAYEANPEDYKMPVIVLLANNKQIEKMVKLIHHICRKIQRNINSKLRYGIIWDEADKIYPQFRNKIFKIGGEEVSIKNYVIDNITGLYRLGFTTASEGELLDEEYPECANAYLYPVVIDPEDQQYYRALHHPEAVTHQVPFTTRHNNNSYAKEILEAKRDHFMTPITLPSGEIYYKKTIINSNCKTSDMTEIARWSNQKGFYAMVFNGFSGASVKVYKLGCPVKTFKTRGKKFNEVLFYVYKKLELNDKPLVIIGRRKVDRGLGFHYCPRTDDEVRIEDSEGVVITQNRDGLIWTDMILGKIEDKNIATQKAGRLAGIIGNSPQYPGSIHYWTDEHTAARIRRHNTIIDAANKCSGCSVLQAVKFAEDTTPKQKVNHRVDMNKFLVYKDVAVVRQICKELGYQFHQDKPIDGFYHTSVNKLSAKASLLDAISKVSNGYGTVTRKDREGEDVSKRSQKYIKIKKGDKKGKFGVLINKLENGNYNVNIEGRQLEIERDDFSLISYRTVYPCYKNMADAATLHYVVIIRPGDEHKVEGIRLRYQCAVDVPQEGGDF